jgi:hypothetical protein
MTNALEQLSLFEQRQRSSPRLSDELVMRQICADLLAEAEIREPPIPMEMVASLRGIATVQRVDQPFAGVIQPRNSGLEVRVRRSDGHERQRFTIGHETGHTLLPGFLEGRQFRCNGARDWLEAMCDVASAEILLPEPMLSERLSGSPLDLSHVESLSSEFQASVEATARRAVSLRPEPSMLIVLSERHKPSEAAITDQVPPKLRVDYRIAKGKWPFMPEHKSAAKNGLARALAGEIIDEVGSIDELCTESVGEVKIHAKRYGRSGRVLALIERI